MKLNEMSIADLSALSHYFADKSRQLEDHQKDVNMMCDLARFLPPREVRNLKDKAARAKDLVERMVDENESRWEEVGDELHERMKQIEWSRSASFDSNLSDDFEAIKKDIGSMEKPSMAEFFR